MKNHSQQKPKLLLLNPPAPVAVIRDYYCSKTSRSNYLFPPIDFIMQSGVLGGDYNLYFIDAVRDRLSEDDTASQVRELDPDVIFFLAGAVNYPGDLLFVAGLAKPGRIIVGSGDIFLSEPSSWLKKYPFLDAISLDFTNHDVRYFLQKNYERIQRMAYRGTSGEVVDVLAPPTKLPFTVGIPDHSLFIHSRYRFPFARGARFSVFLTDFGCPFHCSFCVMASLPYRSRSNDEAITELRSLRKLGISEIFWINQTFGANRKATMELLEQLAAFSPLFSWTTFCRPDVLDEQMLVRMKKAGCHTVIIGVESGSEDILKQYQKGYTKKQVAETFSLCRRHGMRTVGTFILGLPGETRETILATGRLAREIGCDFASFHVAVPRAATKLRHDVIQSGKLDKNDFTMDQSGSYVTMTPEGLDEETILTLKRNTVLRFYLRPSYLLRQLLKRRTIYELANMAYQGFFLIFTTLTKGKK